MTQLIDTIEYLAGLALGATFILSSYRWNSWALWGMGVGALLLTIITKNIAAWNDRAEVKP